MGRILRLLFSPSFIPIHPMKGQGMWSITFWKDAIERSIKSAAQAMLLAWGAGEAFDLFAVDWQIAFGAALGGAALSLLTSIVSAPFGHPGASLVVETVQGS